MGASNSNSKTTNFYSLKAKADESNTPHFTQSVKEGQSWVSKGNFDTMTGYLESAEIKSGTYEGATIKKFAITLSDGDEKSVIEMTHNQITYSIIRCLCGLKNRLEPLEIQVTKKQDKETKKIFGNAFLKVGSEDLKWAFPPADAPKKDPVMSGDKPFMQNGKQVYDSTKLQEFYEQKFQYVINMCKGVEMDGTTPGLPPNVATPDGTETDDIPF